MRILIGLVVVSLVLAVAGTAGATNYVWDMSNASDYWLYGAVLSGGKAVVAAQADDEASVFARINTQLYHLKVGNITGGGYALDNFSTDSPGTPAYVYGSLYLSPTGGGGTDVLILLSPMTIAGSGSGPLAYTFDLDTHADYRTWDDIAGNWTEWDSSRSGTFADVIGMINSSSYSGDYAAFFGPQIGMSGTHNTAFEVTQIELSAVPEPLTMAGVLLGVGCLTRYVRNRKR